MKAKIFEIKRFAVHDGDGIRTTVFFKGCPLRCVWCHNPESLSFKNELAYYEHKCVSCGECVSVCSSGAHSIINNKHVFDRNKCVGCNKCSEVCLGKALTFYGKEVSVDELLPILLEDKEFFDNSNGGVTLSGGECLMQADFCLELLKKLKENGIHTAVDTCGYVKREVLDKVANFVDVFLYDIKAFDSSVHEKCTGKDNKIILENLKYLDSIGKNVEIRIPFVPNYNSFEIENIAKFLSGLNNLTKVRLLNYHNYAGSKYMALGLKNELPENLPTDKERQIAIDTLKKYIKVEVF